MPTKPEDEPTPRSWRDFQRDETRERARWIRAEQAKGKLGSPVKYWTWEQIRAVVTFAPHMVVLAVIIIGWIVMKLLGYKV